LETPPTLEEFKQQARNVYGFLAIDYGFVEAQPPFEYSNRFLVSFTNGLLYVFVEGEGWGKVASVTFEDLSLRRAGIGSLLSWYEPLGERKKPRRSERQLSQLEQMSRDAELLKKYGARLLEGDSDEFVRLWSVLKHLRPPYLRAVRNAASRNDA